VTISGAQEAALPDNLAEWIAAQRWYGGKGSAPRLERLGGWTLEVDGVSIATHYLLDRGADAIVLYQVPLTTRKEPLEGRVAIGRVAIGGSTNGRSSLGEDVEGWVYDGPHDPAYATALLDLIISEAEVNGARGHRQPGAPLVRVSDSAVLSGEQSNTSIICSVENGTPIIIKVFRTLHHGDNPDVILQSAIAAAGSHLVPTSVGYLSGEWHDSGRPDQMARGNLAFAQEFLPGVQDAWRVALRSAERGEDFSAAARALGEATAEVHAILAEVLPTKETSEADVGLFVRGMRARLDAAIAEVPSLEDYRDRIDVVFAAAAGSPWPRLQRIHGDYHLGQVLELPEGGWVLVDFEGEPLRAMTERSEPDVTLRDVAGMLRSFDYVAGSVALTSPPESGNGETATEWASAARHAFVDGYIARSGRDVRQHRALLDAFEIDKALYEAVYEARNRPDWISIPVAAIQRLAERSAL
jgi:maltokinase